MKKTVYVDLDGTLAKWTYGSWKGIDYIDDPLPGAVQFTKDLSRFADVVIYTARCGQDTGRGMAPFLRRNIVREWLDMHGFSYADIYIGQGKPIGACYIDDKAVYCDPQNHPGHYTNALAAAMHFCGEFKLKAEETKPCPSTSSDESTSTEAPAAGSQQLLLNFSPPAKTQE